MQNSIIGTSKRSKKDNIKITKVQRRTKTYRLNQMLCKASQANTLPIYGID